jgi:Tfp pilus assembly protein PilO
MPRNSKSAAGGSRDPRLLVRIVLGVLVAANLAAAALVLFPPGGSAEDLQRQMASLQSQISSNQALLERTRQHLAAVEKGRNEGDRFLSSYFLVKRTASLTLLGELSEAANRSKIKPKENSYSDEPIEGSDSLKMLTITYNLDGAYRDVLSFVHELDRSPRLLIIESLIAVPQQGSNVLSVSMKVDTFVREDASAQAAGAVVRDGESAQAASAVVRDEKSPQAAGAVVRDGKKGGAE